MFSVSVAPNWSLGAVSVVSRVLLLRPCHPSFVSFRHAETAQAPGLTFFCFVLFLIPPPPPPQEC